MRFWQRSRKRHLFVVVAVILALMAPSPVTTAQEPPPDVADVVLEDPLTQPGVLPAAACPTGRNRGQFVEDGWRLSVSGRCRPTDTGTLASQQIAGLEIADGEVRLEFQSAADPARVNFAISARVGPPNTGNYSAYVNLAEGRAEILKIATGQPVSSLGVRTDLADLLSPQGPNTLAFRLQGSRMWLLVNDQPVIAASDGQFERGNVNVTLIRLGNPNDEDEIAVVLRNLRVSSLAGSEQARMPTYEPVVATVPAPPAQTTVAPPPAVGAVIAEDPLLDEHAIIASGTCPTGRSIIEPVGEGLIFKVRGTCTDASPIATAQNPLRGVTMIDGELRIEFKGATGQDRASVVLFARTTGNDNYAFVVNPSTRTGVIAKNVGPTNTPLAQRSDLTSVINTDDWNTFAIRLQGPNLWLLLNDRPILSASDAAFDSGGASLRLGRLGNLNDTDETAVVFRNLRVSALADGDPSRAPTYERP